MTRRAFLVKATTWIGIAIAGVAIVVVKSAAIRAIIEVVDLVYEVRSRPLADLALGALVPLLIIVGLMLWVMPPILAGALGALTTSRRPRLAGAIAAWLVCGVDLGYRFLTQGWHGLMVSAPFVSVQPKAWQALVVGVALALAWWGYWGSLGGAFMANWRAGRRAPNTADGPGEQAA